MNTAKASLTLVALVACIGLAQAAAGIKGQRPDDSQQRPLGIKGPRLQPQQSFLPPPPPPPPAPLALPPPPPRPLPPTKGTGQVAPVFTAARVQPVVQQQVQQQEQEPEIVQQLQQQQQPEESEIDPNAAAQGSSAAIAAPAVAAASEEEANPKPEPYAFNYAFDAADSITSGSSQREEQQDASGKVTGFYTLKGEDGRDRRVDYIADANGFRATISTNELGTAPKDSADAIWQAQAPSDGQLRAAESATQAARQRALLSPQQPLAAGSAQGPSKVSSPRFSGAQQFASATKGQQQQVAAPAASIAQLQEPFEQIRQTELNARSRKSRHAPFYLFTV